MPAIAAVVLTMTVAQAGDIEGTRRKTNRRKDGTGSDWQYPPPQFGPRLDEVGQYQQPVELRGPKGLRVAIQTTLAGRRPKLFRYGLVYYPAVRID